MLSGYAGRVSERIDGRAMAVLSSGHARWISPAARCTRCSRSSTTSSTSRTRWQPCSCSARRSRGRSSSRCSASGRTAHGAIWLIPAGVAAGGIGMALAAVAPSYWLVVVLRDRLGARDGGVPSGGLEVRRVRQRAEAGERDVALLDRRQPRLRPRRARGGAARRTRSGCAAAASSPSRAARRGAATLGLRGYLLGFVPDRETQGAGRRRERPALARAPARRDHVPQPRLVRPDRRSCRSRRCRSAIRSRTGLRSSGRCS